MYFFTIAFFLSAILFTLFINRQEVMKTKGFQQLGFMFAITGGFLTLNDSEEVEGIGLVMILIGFIIFITGLMKSTDIKTLKKEEE
jgi:uncharacterized membrane protein YhhN